jgi:transcription initiation factor IIE alpha subunit
MKFSCPKCKHDVMNLTNVRELTISEWSDIAYLHDAYKLKRDWLGTCDQCGYGWQAKSLSELVENLETVGALK